MTEPAHRAQSRTTPHNRNHAGKPCPKSQPFFLGFGPDTDAVIKPFQHLNVTPRLLPHSHVFDNQEVNHSFSLARMGVRGGLLTALHTVIFTQNTQLFLGAGTSVFTRASTWTPSSEPWEQTYSCSSFFWPCSSHYSCLTHTGGQHAFLQWSREQYKRKNVAERHSPKFDMM